MLILIWQYLYNDNIDMIIGEDDIDTQQPCDNEILSVTVILKSNFCK